MVMGLVFDDVTIFKNNTEQKRKMEEHNEIPEKSVDNRMPSQLSEFGYHWTRMITMSAMIRQN